MNPSDLQQQPLSNEELEELDGFLASDLTPEECIFSIEMLDGYMTALIVGPEVIPPDRWISFIWDRVPNEPFFASEAEARTIREFLVRHMNSIAVQFEEEPDGFFPLFEQFAYADEEEKGVAVENWARGFTVGMELTHASWKPFLEDEEVAQLLLPMFILSRITDDYDDMTEEEMENLTLLMSDFTVKIYHYWKKA